MEINEAFYHFLASAGRAGELIKLSILNVPLMLDGIYFTIEYVVIFYALCIPLCINRLKNAG